jgi:hypothetical protein
VIKLINTLRAWNTSDFEKTFKNEIKCIDKELLPLQQGLSQSSHIGDADISAIILNTTDSPETIHVKAGIFYSGIIAGSCCADDPTPNNEQNEYCELMLDIDKNTAETLVTII